MVLLRRFFFPSYEMKKSYIRLLDIPYYQSIGETKYGTNNSCSKGQTYP